jgi:hypothetical protein
MEVETMAYFQEHSIMTVYLDGENWVVDHSGPIAKEVQDLFGTTILPTPYLKGYEGWRVQLELSNRNPGVIVKLAQ